MGPLTSSSVAATESRAFAMAPVARFNATRKVTMPAKTPLARAPVMMSATHGLSKGDKKQLQKQNNYLFEQGKGQNLKS